MTHASTVCVVAVNEITISYLSMPHPYGRNGQVHVLVVEVKDLLGLSVTNLHSKKLNNAVTCLPLVCLLDSV